jgi:hypothetical protein
MTRQGDGASILKVTISIYANMARSTYAHQCSTYLDNTVGEHQTSARNHGHSEETQTEKWWKVAHKVLRAHPAIAGEETTQQECRGKHGKKIARDQLAMQQLSIESVLQKAHAVSLEQSMPICYDAYRPDCEHTTMV